MDKAESLHYSKKGSKVPKENFGIIRAEEKEIEEFTMRKLLHKDSDIKQNKVIKKFSRFECNKDEKMIVIESLTKLRMCGLKLKELRDVPKTNVKESHDTKEDDDLQNMPVGMRKESIDALFKNISNISLPKDLGSFHWTGILLNDY